MSQIESLRGNTCSNSANAPEVQNLDLFSRVNMDTVKTIMDMKFPIETLDSFLHLDQSLECYAVKKDVLVKTILS